MGIVAPATVVATAQRYMNDIHSPRTSANITRSENLALPHFVPDPRCPVLFWAFNVACIVAATLLLVVATTLAKHPVGGLQLPATGRRPGAQPAVIEVPVPRLRGAPVGIIRRPRVETAPWALLLMALIAMSITRGPAAAELSANLPLPITHAPFNEPMGHAVEALSCPIVFGINVAVAEPSCKAIHEENLLHCTYLFRLSTTPSRP